jgi:hypothetical protein
MTYVRSLQYEGEISFCRDFVEIHLNDGEPKKVDTKSHSKNLFCFEDEFLKILRSIASPLDRDLSVLLLRVFCCRNIVMLRGVDSKFCHMTESLSFGENRKCRVKCC